MEMRLRTICFVWGVLLAGCAADAHKAPIPANQILDQMKKTLLSMFGFNEAPKVHGPVAIPEELRRKLYTQKETVGSIDSTDDLMVTNYGNTIRSFQHVATAVDARFNKDHKFRLKFNLSSVPKEEAFRGAELKLSREAIQANSVISNYQQVYLVDIVQRGIKGVSDPITRVIDTKLLDITQDDSVSLDMHVPVARWLKEPSQNYGVMVLVYDKMHNSTKIPQQKHIRLKRDTNISDSSWLSNQPLLLTYMDDGRDAHHHHVEEDQEEENSRTRRAARRGYRKNERNPCRRRQMYVNFRDVGWSDWIVAPLGYDAFYCDGDCDYPMAEHMNTTNHAIVQSLMNSVRPNDVPKPCCVPTQLSSMSMLYVDSEKNVILKNYKEMVVTGCGCR